MKTLVVENVSKIRKVVPKIEKKIKVRISFGKPAERVSVKGKELDEFVAEKIIKSVDFGFDIEDALLLKDEDFVLEFVDIKKHTPRKKLKDVRARVIGTRGKAKKTIAELTGSVIVIHDNCVGVIVDAGHLDAVVQAIISLIQGAKHGNVFAFLEKQNAEIRKFRQDDLGLKRNFVGKK